MKLLGLFVFFAAVPAHALDAACEPFIAAAEKGLQQPARHSVSELTSGMRMEVIVTGGKFYTMTGGKWRLMKMDLMAAERELNADVRSGKIQLTGCKKLGKESVEGVETAVLAYTLTMPGAKAVSAKAYIGKDGLVYAQTSPDMKVRYRYTGVTAPKL